MCVMMEVLYVYVCVFPFISVTHSNDTLVSTCLPATHWTCSDWRQWGHITPPVCLFPIRGRGSHYSAITTNTDFMGCGKIEQNICYGKWHFTEIILLDLLMSSDLCLIQLVKRSQGISGGGFVTHLTEFFYLTLSDSCLLLFILYWCHLLRVVVGIVYLQISSYTHWPLYWVHLFNSLLTRVPA